MKAVQYSLVTELLSVWKWHSSSTALFLMGIFLISSQALYAQTILDLNRLQSISAAQNEQSDILVVKLSKKPLFEIIPNLKNSVVTIKFYDAFADVSQASKTVNIGLIQGYDFRRVSEKEFWIVVRLKNSVFEFNVIPDQLSQGFFGLAFKKRRAISPLNVNHVLEDVLLTNTSEGERLVLNFNTVPQYEVIENELPSYSTTILLKEASYNGQHITASILSNVVKPFKVVQTDTDVTISLIPKNFGLNYRIYKDNIKNQLIVDFGDLPLNPEIPDNLAQAFIQSQKSDSSGKSKGKSRTELDFLAKLFIEAEVEYRKKNYADATSKFEGIYKNAPKHSLGAKALFRKADIYFDLNGKAERYLDARKSIDEYLKALSVANEISYDSVENQRAMYRIGNIFLDHQQLDPSISYLQQLMELYPEGPYTIEATYLLGKAYHLKGMTDKSFNLLEKFIGKFPSSNWIADAYFFQGNNLFLDKKNKESLEYFNKGLSINPTLAYENPDILYHMAEAFLDQGFAEKARNYYGTLQSRYPNNKYSDYINIRFGDYFRDNHQEASAIQSYAKSIKSLPTEVGITARMRIANIYTEDVTGDSYLKAMEFFQYVIDNFPDTLQAQQAAFRMALSHGLHGDYNEAIKHIEDFRQDYPSNRYVKSGLLNDLVIDMINANLADNYLKERWVHSGQLYVDKLSYLKGAYSRLDSPLLAISSEKAHLNDQAIEIYNNALLSANIEDADYIKFRLAKKHRELGNNEKALKTLGDIITNYTDSIYRPLSIKLKADMHIELNQTEEALDFYNKLIDEYSKNGNPVLFPVVNKGYFSLGKIFEDIGRFKDGRDYFQKTISNFKYPLSDDRVPAYIKDSFFKIGEMEYEMGELEDAKTSLEAALARFPNYERMPWAKYFLGQIHFQRNDINGAIKIYKELEIIGAQNANAVWARLTREALLEAESTQNFNEYLQQKPSASN